PRCPPATALFPYTTLFRSVPAVPFSHNGFEVLGPDEAVGQRVLYHCAGQAGGDVGGPQEPVPEVGGQGRTVGHDRDGLGGRQRGDRKSTRLNSSHSQISYA